MPTTMHAAAKMTMWLTHEIGDDFGSARGRAISAEATVAMVSLIGMLIRVVSRQAVVSRKSARF
jgi:hypothetical protein